MAPFLLSVRALSAQVALAKGEAERLGIQDDGLARAPRARHGRGSEAMLLHFGAEHPGTTDFDDSPGASWVLTYSYMV